MAKTSEIDVLLAMGEMVENNGASMKKILNMAKQRDSSLNMRNVLVTIKRGMQRGYVTGDGGKYKLALDDACPQPCKKKTRRPPRCPSKPRCPRRRSRGCLSKPVRKPSCKKSKPHCNKRKSRKPSCLKRKPSRPERKPSCPKRKPCRPKPEPCSPKKPSCPAPKPSCPKPKPCSKPRPCSPKPRPSNNPCCPKPQSPKRCASPSSSKAEVIPVKSPEKQQDGPNPLLVPRASMKRDITFPTLQFPPDGFLPRML